MAGLDTRGLASGFAQGFGLMSQYQQQQRQNELAERQMGMQEQKFGLDMQMGQMRMDEVEREREKEALTFALARGAEFGPEGLSEEDMELLRNKPQVWAAFDDRADAAIRRAIDVFDPGTSIDANDVESLDQANLLFQDMINKGEGGQKRIVGWYPSPDGEAMMAELEITREDGSTYRAPMTEGRGTEEDAIVKRIPLEDLANHIQGLRQVRNGINMGGDEFRANASRMLRVLRGEASERWEQVQGPGGSILQRNASTGEMKSVIGRAPQQAGGGQGAPTAMMKEAQWMVDQGIAADIPSAFETLRRSRGDDLQRDRLQMQTISGDIDTITRQLSSGFHPDGEQGLAALSEQLASLRAQRDQLGERIFYSPASGPNQSEAQQGPSRQVQPSASAMGDEDILNSILRDL